MSAVTSAATSPGPSRPTTPELPSTKLELHIPKQRTTISEAKFRNDLKRSREASEEAVHRYRKLSGSLLEAETRYQRALNLIEAATTVLQTQQEEAAVRVRALQSIAQKASKRGLSDSELADLETDIATWTKLRTEQELMLKSANSQKMSALDQLSDLSPEKCQGVLEILLTLPIIHMRAKRPGQAQWKREAFALYAASRRAENVHPKDAEQAWCPVMGEWMQASQVKAAHVLPYSMTNEVARMILGEDEDTNIIFDTSNCIPLWTPIEAAFDKGAFVIVPTNKKEPEGPTDYKLVLLDESYRTTFVSMGASPKTWNDLDGTVLRFRNEFRPRQRYVYLSYVSRIIAARQLKYSRHSRDRLESTGAAWVSPGPWIRKSMIREVARIVGDHEVPGMLEEGAFDDEGEPESPTKARVARSSASWVTEVFAQQVFQASEHEGDEEDEEEEE